MSGDSARNHPPPQRQTVRVQYLDCRSEDDYREFRFALFLPEGPADVRLRIPVAAFAASRVLLQDGPDVCYQRLLRMLAAGWAPDRSVITVEDAELESYREAHTPAPRRVVTPRSSPKRAWVTKPPAPERHPTLPVAVAPPAGEAQQAFAEGQRVTHAVFGAGVTMASSEGRTSVQFDDHGVKTFVTSMLKLERLSAPHEWEAGPRGKNRRRGPDAEVSASRKRRA
ncbi:MAG TPA: hypothetical protein VEI47_06280 [Gemmatimonadales bacterium]|nr:hypothetical protein [Gemmatimonadales bacterium]